MRRRPRHGARAALLGAVLTVASCGGQGDGPAPADAAAPSLEVGAGTEGFLPLADGETLPLVRGAQGLQHVYVALRARGLAPRGALVSLSLVRERDGALVSAPFEARLSLVAGPGDVADLWGLVVVVPAPDDALGEGLSLEARVTDRDGVAASASRAVRVEWAP